MKCIFLVTFFIISMFSQAQPADTSFAQIDAKFKNASKELTKFNSQFQGGIMLEIFGGVLVGVGGASSNNKGAQQGLVVGGALLALIGFGINLSSSVHVKNAGIILRGGSLVVPIKNKKPITIFRK